MWLVYVKLPEPSFPLLVAAAMIEETAVAIARAEAKTLDTAGVWYVCKAEHGAKALIDAVLAHWNTGPDPIRFDKTAEG